MATCRQGCISALLMVFALASAAQEPVPGAALPLAPAVATRIQLTPHINLLGVKQVRDCAIPLDRLKAELQTLAYPVEWVILIGCTPLAWENAWRRAGQPPTRTGFTSLQARVTVLNGAIFRGLQAEYRHTIAHELAHIRCACADDRRAEHGAARLLRP